MTTRSGLYEYAVKATIIYRQGAASPHPSPRSGEGWGEAAPYAVLESGLQISIRYRLSPPVPGGYELSLPAPRGNVGHYSAARYERRQGAALRQVGWPQYPDRRAPPGDQRQIQPDIQPPLRYLEREALAGPLEYWGRSRVRWFARRSARQQTSDAIAPSSRPPRLSPEAALHKGHLYSGYAQANCAQ